MVLFMVMEALHFATSQDIPARDFSTDGPLPALHLLLSFPEPRRSVENDEKSSGFPSILLQKYSKFQCSYGGKMTTEASCTVLAFPYTLRFQS